MEKLWKICNFDNFYKFIWLHKQLCWKVFWNHKINSGTLSFLGIVFTQLYYTIQYSNQRLRSNLGHEKIKFLRNVLSQDMEIKHRPKRRFRLKQIVLSDTNRDWPLIMRWPKDGRKSKWRKPKQTINRPRNRWIKH